MLLHFDRINERINLTSNTAATALMLPIVCALVKKVARYDKMFTQTPQISILYRGNQVRGR